MKHVGIREFRDHATRYLASGSVLAIERHDQIIGFYIPVRPAPDDKVRPALERLTKAVDRVLAETGMSEAELTTALRPAKRGTRPA
jgi:hypothetical protein